LGRRQLDGQWEAIYALTDRGHVVETAAVQCKIRIRLAGAFHKQRHRRTVFDWFRRTPERNSSQRERLEQKHLLSPNPQRHAAGRKHAQVVTSRKQRGDGVSTCVNQVLAVIEDQEEFALSDEVNETVEHAPALQLEQVEGLGERNWEKQRIQDGGQAHEDHPIGEVSELPAGGFESQTGLAHTPRSSHRQQPRTGFGEQLIDALQFG
jgi:hypothetical protein